MSDSTENNTISHLSEQIEEIRVKLEKLETYLTTSTPNDSKLQESAALSYLDEACNQEHIGKLEELIEKYTDTVEDFRQHAMSSTIRFNFHDGIMFLIRLGVAPRVFAWFDLGKYGTPETYDLITHYFTPQYHWIYKGIGNNCNIELFKYLMKEMPYHPKATKVMVYEARYNDHFKLLQLIKEYVKNSNE